jgi:Doubled CXXCH motif (Paired_CXXCH_1)
VPTRPETAGPPRATRLAPALLAFVLCAPRGLAQAEPQGSCERCHADVAQAEARRPHARAGIGCTACHGGDATQETREAAEAPEAGFKGALHGAAIVTLCGDCHADVERMNPYGLRTDQLAQYRTSAHGKALFAKGDESVATCASCHGAHGILGPASGESPVHATNVPATCAKCHADQALMSKHGLDAKIPDAWHKSVHAAYVLEKGDLSAPVCTTCHGSHGAVPPGFRTVGAVCGKCHVRELELFQTSPHAPLVAEGDFPGCETCHGNHDIPEARLTILERTCNLCHTGDEEKLKRRDRILADLRSSDEQLASTQEALRQSAQLGLVTEEDRLLFEEAHTALQQARAGQHALDADALETTTGEAAKTLRELAARLQRERRDQRLRRLAVVPVVAFLLLMSAGFWVRYRRIHHLS